MLVDEEIDLLRVPRTIEHVAGVLLLVADDDLFHFGHRRQPVATGRVRRDEAGLALDKREQRGCRLGESDKRQIVDAGLEHPLVQRDVVVGSAHEVLVEEREGDVVPRGVDDDVEVGLCVVVEMHCGPVEATDIGLGDDIARPEPQRQFHRLRRMRLEELVIGSGQPEVLRSPRTERLAELHQLSLP